MIVRVIRARVRAGRVGQFNETLRRQVATLHDQPGLRYVKLARRLEPDGGEEVVLIEEWREPDDLYAWAGNDLSNPGLPAESLESVIELSVTPYESLDREPDDSA